MDADSRKPDEETSSYLAFNVVTDAEHDLVEHRPGDSSSDE